MAQQVTTIPISIKYGHTETQVVMIFSTQLSQLGMEPAEVDAMITSLQMMKAELAKMQAAKAAQAH